MTGTDEGNDWENRMDVRLRKHRQELRNAGFVLHNETCGETKPFAQCVELWMNRENDAVEILWQNGEDWFSYTIAISRGSKERFANKSGEISCDHSEGYPEPSPTALQKLKSFLNEVLDAVSRRGN